jgi:DNA-binding XRE family transcriptional regulator
MSQMTIRHELGDVVVNPTGRVSAAKLRRAIREALDRCREDDPVPASAVHAEARERHGENYRTPGYFLRLYRRRAALTQTALAERAGLRQHHLSEMEHNKRAIGKSTARRLAEILDCDYRRLL